MSLLPVRMVAKPWGRESLPQPFVAPTGERIGEVWFEPPAELPQLLVKYIFTSEALSVQVHPSDAQVPGEGKEECWLVIAAEPGARLGIGFREALDAETLRAASLDGSIEQLLRWFPVAPGDFFYIPANTVHAIGAGVSLIEVQQNSDTTYRLYDYGRPRELHLDDATAVSRREPYAESLHRHLPAAGAEVLVDGPRFRLDRLDGPPDEATLQRYGAAPVLVIPTDGEAHIAGDTLSPGTCALAPGLAEVTISGSVLIAQPCGT